MSVVYILEARLLDPRGKPKACSVGKAMNVSCVEAAIVVHCHRPLSDGRLRVQGKPVFIENGVQVLSSSSILLKERVEARRILYPVQLLDGVLPHRVFRQLDNMGFRFAYTNVASGVRPELTSVMPSLGSLPSVHRTLDGETFAALVD